MAAAVVRPIAGGAATATHHLLLRKMNGALVGQILLLLVSLRILFLLHNPVHHDAAAPLQDAQQADLSALTPVPSPLPILPPSSLPSLLGDYAFGAAEVLLPTAHRRAERVARHCRDVQLDLIRPSERKPRLGFEFGRWWQDNWEPTWACPLEERIQKRDPLSAEAPSVSLADGGKWVCDPLDTLARPSRGQHADKCIVYSFGSNGEFSFEFGLDDRVQGGCEIHTFDPFTTDPVTLPHTPAREAVMQSQAELKRRGIVVHELGLASHDFVTPPLSKWNNRRVVMRSLQTIARDLNHTGRVIDVLKVDVDGSEYNILGNETWWGELDASGLKIGQLLLEVHFNPVSPVTFRFRDENNAWVQAKKGPEVDSLFRVLADRGFVIFHKEINLTGKPPNDAGEFGLLRLNLNCSAPLPRAR